MRFVVDAIFEVLWYAGWTVLAILVIAAGLGIRHHFRPKPIPPTVEPEPPGKILRMLEIIDEREGN